MKPFSSTIVLKKIDTNLKNSVKHIAVAYLIAIISISTMGVSVNSLYCFCTGETKVSVFEIQHICTKEPSESTQLPEGFSDLPPCCQVAIKKAACHNHEHDCTKKTKKHIKADLKFVELKKTELPNIELVAFVPSVMFSKIISPKFDLQNVRNETLPRPPPPQYFGRKLLNFIQVYRC